jgi:ABC-2 type transport system permease protein
MRYIHIFFLYLQGVFEHRMRSLVWFFISLLNPILLLLFWQGALPRSSGVDPAWTLKTMSSYYFLLIIAGALLMSHTEDDVATIDIQEGGLSSYLVKPVSYYWIRFFNEIPYRFLQGFYGIIIFFICSILFPNLLSITTSFEKLFLAVIICILAFFISFTFKMIMGFIAFWTTDIKGIYGIIELSTLIFAGYLVPLSFFPPIIAFLSHLTPFPYIIYYPVIAFGTILDIPTYFKIIGTQIVWVIVLYGLYKFLWKHGIKKFTAIGQ